MILAFILLQAADPAPAPAPDIELVLHAKARSVEIERKGVAKLEVTADPDGGSAVETKVTPKSRGAARLRNVDVDIHAGVRITDPQQNPGDGETSAPE